MDVEIKSKRSQVTIFIIIAIVIVALILLVFIFRKPPTVERPDENNPQTFIESCAKEALEEAIIILSPQGGDIEPKGSVLYEGKKRVYLCYTSEYYKPCKNQRPMLIEHIEEEITNHITPIIERCFSNLKSTLSERYEITERQLTITTKLKPQHIQIDINKYFKMDREDKTQEFEEFKLSIFHPMYDLAEVSSEITNQEIEHCYFDNLGYMIIHPQFEVTKFETGRQDMIYTVKDQKTGQDFTFAIRSCVMPPGI